MNTFELENKYVPLNKGFEYITFQRLLLCCVVPEDLKRSNRSMHSSEESITTSCWNGVNTAQGSCKVDWPGWAEECIVLHCWLL